MKQLLTAHFWRSLIAFTLAIMMPFNAVAGTLQLPAAIQVVQEQAFMNNTSVDKVVLPEGATTIESQAFKGATALKRVVIPESVDFIADDAFDGIEGLVVETPRNSYAWNWAASKAGIAVEDPESPFTGSVDQLMQVVYLNATRDECMIATAVIDTELPENVTIEWTLEQQSGEKLADLNVMMEDDSFVTVWTEKLYAAGTASWMLKATTSEGESWSDVIELTVEALPEGLPTEIIMPEVFTADIGSLFQFLPSERLSHNGTIPEGAFWNYNINISGDILDNEEVSYPTDGVHGAFSFTPDSAAVYSFRVFLNVANYTISAPATLIVGDPESLKVTFEQQAKTLYLEGGEEAMIGWVSYEGLKSDPTLGTQKIVSTELEKVSGDDCAELSLDSTYYNEVWAKNFTTAGTAVWRVSAVLSDGSSWSDDITVTVASRPEDYPSELSYSAQSVELGETFEFNWDEVSLVGELPEDGNAVNKSFRLYDPEGYSASVTKTENGFTFVPDKAGDYTLTLTYRISNVIIELNAMITVIEKPTVEFGGRVMDTVYATGSADGFTLGNLVPQVEVEEGDKFEWSIALKESSNATPAAVVGFNRFFGDAGPAVIGLMSLSGEAGMVTYTITVKHGENEYTYDYTLNVIEAPATLPTGITVPATSYQIEVDEVLSLSMMDTRFEGGQVPEGVSANFRFSWNAEETGLTIRNSGTSVNITGVTPGTYTISACAAILNREYAQPITITVKEPKPALEFIDNLLDTVYDSGDSENFWLGTLLADIELAEGEELEWTATLTSHSGDEPVATVELSNTYESGHVAQFHLMGLTGETGDVTYTMTAKYGEHEYTYDYTLSVVEAPENLPTAITMPQTLYRLELKGMAELKLDDVVYVDGQIPEGVGTRNEFDWEDENVTGLIIEETSDGLQIIGLQEGVYELEAYKAILNYQYFLPITIIVGEVSPLSFSQHFQTLYLEGNQESIGIAGFYYDGELGEDVTINYSLEKVSGDEGVELVVDGDVNANMGNIVATSVTASGTSVWRATAVMSDGTEVSEDFTVNVSNMPEDYPAEIIDPQYTGKVGEVFEFNWDDISLDGAIPEDGNTWLNSIGLLDVWGHETYAETENGFTFTPDRAGGWQLNLRYYTANHLISRSIKIMVEGDASAELSVYDPTLYLEGNVEETDIAAVNVDFELAEGEQISYTIECYYGDDCVDLSLRTDEKDGTTAYITAGNVRALGSSTWRVEATLPDGSVWADFFNVSVENLPENYPTEIVDPGFTGRVGELFELDTTTLELDAEFPEAGTEGRWSIGLRDVWNHETLELTENGFTFIPDHAGHWELRISYIKANYSLELVTSIAVEGTNEMDVFQYFKTLYLEGNMDEMDIADISVDTLLTDDEAIDYQVEYASGDKCVDLSIVGISKDGLSAYVLASNITGTGETTWQVSATLPDGTVKSEEITVTVANMPEDYPTALVVEEPLRGTVGERFEFKPSERVSFNGTLPEDGNTPIAGFPYIDYDLWEHPTFEWIDDGENGAIAFTSDQNIRYGYTVAYTLANHRLEHSGLIVIGDGYSDAYLETNQFANVVFAGVREESHNAFSARVEGYELFGDEDFYWTLEHVSGEELANVFINDYHDGNREVAIGVDQVGDQLGTMTYRLNVTSEGGLNASCEFSIEVQELPENLPTAIKVPYAEYNVEQGDTLELLYDDIQFEEGEIPEGINAVSEYWLADKLYEEQQVEWTDNGVEITFEQDGRYVSHAVLRIGNYYLRTPVTITVGNVPAPTVESIHYFPTLYLEGNQDEMDVFQIEVDMELAEDEAIDYRVEKVSGDDCFDYRIECINDDPLSALVIISNLTDVGSATLRASATLPDGTEWISEDFTVSVVHMPEDYPTELIVDYPIYGNVGERFEFRPSERVGFDGTLPDDGNLKFCFTSIYYEIAEHETYEQVEDDHHTAFAFTPDENARYGFSLYYYLGNHCLEHHGIIIIGDGNSSIGYAEADVMDTIFAVESEQEEHFWVGNAMLHRFHTLPDEKISWDLQLVDSSNEEPAVTLELTDTFEGTHGVNMDAVAMSGETGWVTYRVTASWDQSSWFDDFTINVVNQPEGLPAGITVSPDYYHAESGEQLNMLYSSIQLAEGEIPEGIEPVFEYWIPDEMRDEQQVDWTDEGVTVEARQEGRYQFEAAVRIGNYTLTAPITVVIGEEPTNEADVFHYFPTLYLEGNVEEMDVARITVDTLLWNEESIDYRVEYVSGDKCMDMFIAGISEDGLSAFAVACNLTDVGQSTWQVSATLPDGTVTSEEITVTVAHMPEDYPTELIVEEPLRIEVGEYFEFKPSERVSFNGTLPEDGNTPIAGFPYIDYDLWEHPTFEWINDGENGAIAFKIDENVRYNYTLAYTLSNHRLEHSGTIVIGDGISDARMGYDQPMKVAYTGIEDDVYAISGWVEGYALAVDEAFHWDLQFVEGEELAQAYINAEPHGGVYEVPVIVRNVGDQTGTLVLRLSVTSDGGLELYQDFTIEILELPENLPTEIRVKNSEYQINEGETLEFLYSDIEFVDGEIPEGVEPVFEYWEFDRQGDVEWIDDGLRVTFHERGYYRGQAAAKIGNYTLTTPVVVKVGEDVGIMLDRPTTTHYINDNGFTWSGDLKLEGFFPLEDEHIEWRMERIDENEATPAEVYFDNEFDDGFGIGVYLRNFSGETGSMTYRFIASSDWGGEWSVEHTINVEHMPENFPTGIAMPDGGVVNLPVGDILYAGYNMIEFVGGEVPEGADVYLEFWPDTVEEYGDPFEWNDNGFSSVLKQEGRYFFHAAAYVNGVEMIKQVKITVGDGNLDEAGLGLYRFAPVQFIPPYEEYSPNWVVEAYLENYNVFPGEELMWNVELLEGDPDLASLYLDVDDGGKGALARLGNFSGETGSMTWAIHLTSSEGYSWTEEISFEIAEAPEGFATGVTMPNNNVAYLNPGDTLVANYDMIGFNGDVPEDATVYRMFWSDTAEEYGDPFEWNDNGFTSVLHEGRYLFKAVAYINGVELWSPVNVIVGDVSLEFNELALVQYINPDPNGANMLGHVSLERYHMMDYERLHWDVEFVEGDEGIAELYLDVFHDTSGARMMLNNFSGESGSMTWRITARNDEDLVWSEEVTFQLAGCPDYLPTGINMPGNGIVHLDPGQLLVANYDMISFEEGAPSETDIVYFNFWTDTVEEFGDPFEWNEDGFTSVLHEEGRYFFQAVAYINGIQYNKEVAVIVGDGISDNVSLKTHRLALVQYPNPYPDWENWLGSLSLENYSLLPGEELQWSVELLEGDESLANLYLEYWDEPGVDMRLNQFSGESGSMTWRVSVQNEDNRSWSEEITFEIVGTPSYLPMGINMPNDGVVHLNPGDTLVANYDMIEFVGGAPSETDIVYLEFWTDSVEEFADSFEWNDNGFTAVLNREGRYFFRAIAFVNGIMLAKQVKVTVGDGISENTYINLYQRLETAYSGVDEEVYAAGAFIQEYELSEGESFHWNLEQVSGDEGLLDVYINNEQEEGRQVHLHARNFSDRTGSATYCLSVTTEEGLNLSREFTITMVERPENLPTELIVTRDHDLQANETFYFGVNDVQLNGELPEGVEAITEWWGTEQLQERGDWTDYEGQFSVTLPEEGVYRFEAVVLINNYVLRAPVTLYVGNLSDRMIYSVSQFNPIYNNFGDVGTPVDELETLFYQSHFYMLEVEKIHWDLEVLNDDGNLPAELFIRDGQDCSWVSIYARNSTGTGTINYKVTATLESGRSYTYENSVDVTDVPEGLPETVTGIEDEYHISAGERIAFTYEQLGFEGGEVPEGTYIRPEFWIGPELTELEEFEWTEDGFAVTLYEEGEYVFNAAFRFGSHCINRPVSIIVGSYEGRDPWINAQQENYSMHAYMNANLWIGSFDVLDYELAEGERYHWTLEKISDENVNPVNLYIDNYYDNDRGVNVHATDVNGTTGSVTYLLTVTTEGGLSMSHEITVEVTEGRDDLPTDISVPHDNLTVYAGNVITLRRSDIQFVDGNVLEDDYVRADYWNLECLGEQTYGWDADDDTLLIHFTIPGTYTLKASMCLGGLYYGRDITINVVERGENDPYVDWAQDIHTIYTGIEEYSTWIGWGVLENYDVNSGNEINWRLDRIDGQGYPPVDLYMEVYDDGLHADIRYTNVRDTGNVIYRLSVETSDGFMDSREIWLNVEELPENLPTELNMQTVYELEVGDTFEFDVSEITFANGEVPEGASERQHVINMDALYAMEGFEWTDNGFRVPMNQEGRYVFTFGKQIGNYTVSQDVAVLVGNAYPESAVLDLFIQVPVVFNDPEIQSAWIGNAALNGYELADNETVDWQLECIDQNEATPVRVDFQEFVRDNTVARLQVSDFNGETGEMTYRVTARTNTGYEASREFTLSVVERPANKPTDITVPAEVVNLNAGSFYSINADEIGFADGDVPESVTSYVEYFVSYEVMDLPDFQWTENGIEFTVPSDGRYSFDVNVFFGGYTYSKTVYVNVGSGLSENVRFEGMQKINTVYLGLDEGETTDHLAWYSVVDHVLLPGEAYHWNLEKTEGDEIINLRLDVDDGAENNASVRINSCSGDTGTVKYRVSVTSEAGIDYSADLVINVAHAPEGLPNEVVLPWDNYHFEVGDTVEFLDEEIGYGDGNIPDGALVLTEIWNMDSIPGSQRIYESDDPEGDGYRITFEEEGHYQVYFAVKIENKTLVQPVVITVGSGIPSDAWLETWGTERTLYVGLEHCGWALDAELRNYNRVDDEEFYWNLEHVDGPEMDIVRNEDAGDPWLGVWYDIRYTGDETGRSVYRLTLDTEYGFHAEQYFVYYLIERPDDLPSDMFVPAEDIELQIGETYGARYEDMWLTDDGYVPEDAEVRHEFHVPDSLSGYHGYEWTDEGFKVTFTENGRYSYHAVIKVNGFEYRKEVRIVVGSGIADDVKMGFFYGFDGLHYINDNTQWIGDMWLENYNVFEGEGIHWNVWPTDEAEPKANVFVDPVWNDGLNAAIRMDSFTGETGVSHYTVSVETDGGYYEEYEIEFELIDKPENFPEEIFVHQEDVYLQVNETYSARMNGFYWFNEGSVIPEGANHGAEFWPEELEWYHTFEWVEGGFDVTFTEPGRHHFYVNAAINGVDFTKEIRLHVGNGIPEDAHLNFEHAFVQHFINDQTQWIGDVHLENYLRFDNEEIRWEIEYLDEGEPLANVFIDPVWNDGMDAGVRVNDFRGEGEMNLRLRAFMDNNFSLFRDFSIVLLPMPENLPSDIVVEQEEIQLRVGETYEARTDGFAWFTDDGEIRYDIAEFFHEFYVGEELSNYHGFEWVEGGFNVTFYEEGRYHFYVAVTVNGVEYCKEIRLLVGDGMNNNARVEFHQATYTAYAAEEGDAWIGHAELEDYWVFDNEQVNWWVERIDENDVNPLNAYVANVWDPQYGANVHVDNFTGETGEVTFRVWAESEYGFSAYTDFTVNVVEQPEGLPTILYVPSDNMTFNVGDEFVIHDYDLTLPEDCVIPENANLHYEYWDPEGTFYNQEVRWNEENGGVTVHFHNEGRYEFTVSLLINTYRLTRTIRIVVGDGMDEEAIHMSLSHMIDPVYIGLEGACRIGNAYIENFNVFEGEDIEWTIEPKNAEETDAAEVFVSSNWENKLGANFAVDNTTLTAVGETVYVVKAVLPTGMEVSEEITLHVEELPEGLPAELFVEQDEHNLMIGDTFTMMCSEVQFGEGFIPENAAVHVELWPDENLENLPGFEPFHDDETGDNGIHIRFDEPGEYVITVAAWIGNWMLFKEVRLNVTEPWKMAVLVCSPDQVEEEYVAAMDVLETYGDEHVIIETFPGNFAENVEETIAQIVGFAERDAVKAIIVSQAVLGTSEAFRQINEVRPDMLLISGIPSEPIASLAAQADIVMYADEAAQAQPMMDNCEAWGVDALVHYSFDRHMDNEVIAERYNRLAEIGQEKGIEVIYIETPDPIASDDGFDQMTGFIAESVAEVLAEREGQKVAFFGTNCGMQATLQSLVLDNENAYYPQPCCPSPYHGFGESLGLDLSFGMNPKDALRAIGNALAEYDAAERFATGALSVNMGIIEAAAQYAAGYAEGEITSQNDGDVINQMFNAKFGNPAGTSTEYDNVYAADVEIVTFAPFVGVYQAKIAVLTGSELQGYEEYLAAQQYIEAYGEDRVIIDYYPDNFSTDEAYETIVSKITGFAEDPNVSAIIVMQSVPGTLEGFRQVRQMRDDVLLISGAPQEDMNEMSGTADIMLYSDEPAQAKTIMDTCEKWEIDKFVHLSFERHMSLGSVSARFERICERANELGISVIEAEITDPAVDFDGALQSVRDVVDGIMAESEGEKVAFFSTNCGVQATLQSAVLEYGNAYYPQPCCPSPYHGFSESLGLELDPAGNHRQALRDIANALYGRDAVDRFSTCAMPVNMGIMEVAGKYAIAYANDELPRKHDSDAMQRLLSNTLSGADVSNEVFYNGYSILLDPVDFNDYAGVYEGKIAIVTGNEGQGYEELLAAHRAMDTYGEQRVVLETYPDNFMDQQHEVADRIAALAEDPNVEAIIVMQSVPGTLEGFYRVRDVRDDVLLISGLPLENFDEMSGVADLMLFADEPAQAYSIMDKCEEWGVDAFVHLSFERHMQLGSVQARFNLICERAEEAGIEVIAEDIIDPSVNFNGALESVREAVDRIMTEYEGQKVAFYSTNCGVQSALQSAVLEYDNAYYPLPCCPSPYHGFPETLGLELDLYDSKAAMRSIANALHELGAAHRFSTWASPVNMSIIDVAADYAIAYVDGNVAKGEEAETLRNLYAHRFDDARVDDTEFGNGFAVRFDAADFISYVNTDDMIQVWVAETMVDFTAEQFESFKQENEQYAHVNINIRAVGEGDAVDGMAKDPYYGADIFGFAQDQLSRMYNTSLATVPDEYAEIIRESNDAGSVAAATMNDSLCAYPMTSDNGYFLYYDKSVVSDPSSLETILADCEAAGKTFHMELTSGWYQPAFFFGTGCDLFYYTNDETGEFDNHRIDVLSENGLNALKSMIKVADSPAFRNGSEAAEGMGALVSGTWAAQSVQDLLGDHYAAVKLPTVDGYQMSSFGGYKLLGVNYQDSEYKQELCNAFAMYLTSENAQLARFELAGWGPSNLNAQQNEAVQNNVALNALLSQMEYAVPQGQYPGEYWEASEQFGERLVDGSFSDLSDEELWELLKTYQEMLTSFIIIIA